MALAQTVPRGRGQVPRRITAESGATEVSSKLSPPTKRHAGIVRYAARIPASRTYSMPMATMYAGPITPTGSTVLPSLTPIYLKRGDERVSASLDHLYVCPADGLFDELSVTLLVPYGFSVASFSPPDCETRSH